MPLCRVWSANVPVGPNALELGARPYVYTTTLDEDEMLIVEAALPLYHAYARKELARDPSAPFSGAEESIESIRMTLYLGMSATKPSASDDQRQTNPLPQFIFSAMFGVLECAYLDEALVYYRACQEEQGAEASVSALDECIENIRRKLRPNFIPILLAEDL
jgi:hypothetical protein